MAILTEQGNAVVRAARAPAPAAVGRRGLWGPLHVLAVRYPFAMFLLLVLVSNLTASVFNVAYNTTFIAAHFMDEAQSAVFEHVAIPLYNAVAYPACFALAVYLLYPLHRCLNCLRRGRLVAADHLAFCRRRVVNLPWLQVCINFAGWLPGAVIFPLIVCGLGGDHNAWNIWFHFVVSFAITAVFATAQTFFIIEGFLVAYLYSDFFRDARPENVAGARLIPFRVRLWLLWLAVAWMPMVSLFAVTFSSEHVDSPAAWVLFGVSTVSSMFIFGLMGHDLRHWVKVHAAATEQISHGNFEVRIAEQRPDEWGRLTNHFNDMARALSRAREESETFGQFVSPEVRDQILARMPGLQVALLEITVMFADIRGFTHRCAGEPPERIGALLNRFLTLALRSVEDRGGLVNKFLGDGFMALYGATQPCDDHADIALASAQDLLVRLRTLNHELAEQGQPPLKVGIGIHTGPALVGCFGAALEKKGGMRREFTAIGETVNFCQRLEQLTKTHGGPILLSEATRCRLRCHVGVDCLGPQPLPGAPEPIVVHRTGDM